MKDSVNAQLRDQQAEFRKDRSAQTKSRHYRSLLNNRLSETRYYESTSLTMKRRLTV
uniref:Transposase n=1 Tax=Schistosoma curassoni TaxID=6186 RepID=A0A183K5Y4_9TREM